MKRITFYLRINRILCFIGLIIILSECKKDNDDLSPVADFIADSISVKTFSTVLLTDQSTNNPTSWLWDFGNGETSNNQNPYVIYKKPGIYSISLIVSNNYGLDTLIKTNYINVSLNTSTVIDYEGNVYKTIGIGDRWRMQWWMAENLKSRYYADGTPLENGTGKGSSFDDYSKKYFFVYMNEEESVDTWGLYYTWEAASRGAAVNYNTAPTIVQGVCPDGWHLPNDDDWNLLIFFVGGEDSAGIKLREQGYNHWSPTPQGYPEYKGTDDFAFTVLAAGMASSNGYGYYEMRKQALFWSSTNSEMFGDYYIIEYDDKGMWSGGYLKNNGLCVRCLKD